MSNVTSPSWGGSLILTQDNGWGRSQHQSLRQDWVSLLYPLCTVLFPYPLSIAVGPKSLPNKLLHTNLPWQGGHLNFNFFLFCFPFFLVTKTKHVYHSGKSENTNKPKGENNTQNSTHQRQALLTPRVYLSGNFPMPNKYGIIL